MKSLFVRSLFILFIFFSCNVICRGGTPSTPSFYIHNPVRDIHHDSYIYREVCGHTPASGVFNRGGIGTIVHETTHEVNSIYRNFYTKKLGKKVNALYVLNGRVFVMEEPKLTLSQISQNIPNNMRGKHTFNLYLVQARQWWNNEPLYILDEWVSYINGAAVNVENNQSTQGSLEFSIDFMGYAHVLLNMAPSDKLRNFVVWHSKRTIDLLYRGKQKGLDADIGLRKLDILRKYGPYKKNMKNEWLR